MKRLLSFYSPKAPLLFAYMLQIFEYDPRRFLKWLASLPNLFEARKRGSLKSTQRATAVLFLAYTPWVTTIVLAILMSFYHTPLYLFLILIAPMLSLLAIILADIVLQTIIVTPVHKAAIRKAAKKLGRIQATRIAVLGSYGKTTMKELLVTVLSEGKNVAATPGNLNVLISHARWILTKVKGDEDVLVFEYGEAGPGDIMKFASFSHPGIAIITGLAPAHLDAYPSLQAIAKDFATIQQFVKNENIFMYEKARLLQNEEGVLIYGSRGIGDSKATDIKMSFDGVSFTLHMGKEKLKLETGLLGIHQIGPLCAVATIAKRLGLTNQQIVKGIRKTIPFEHRMQARQMHDAWIIDDTYNGNLEGMRAGLELLKSLPAKRKIYVTPGLVDQGEETQDVHIELGALIADAQPDRVVLMENSVTPFIKAGLISDKFKGELVIEDNPLEFYTNLEHFLAAGDVVMLQNDWPDSYK